MARESPRNDRPSPSFAQASADVSRVRPACYAASEGRFAAAVWAGHARRWSWRGRFFFHRELLVRLAVGVGMGAGHPNMPTDEPAVRMPAYLSTVDQLRTSPSPTQSFDHDEHEARVMQQLYEARKRLESANHDADADHVWLAPSSAILSRPPSASPRPLSPTTSGAMPQRTQMRRPHSLTLDLKDVPFTALVDAERRRLSETVPTGSSGPDARPATRPVPPDNSGSHYGMAPFMHLERDEWVWQYDVRQAPMQVRPSHDTTATPSKVTHVQEEWAWAVAGPAPATMS